MPKVLLVCAWGCGEYDGQLIFVRAYIEKASGASQTAELLIFLFQLSFLQLGEHYATEQLTPAQLNFQDELARIG